MRPVYRQPYTRFSHWIEIDNLCRLPRWSGLLMHLFESPRLAATFHIISTTYVFDRGLFLRTGQGGFRPPHPSHPSYVSSPPREVHQPYHKRTFHLGFMMVREAQRSWKSGASRIKNRQDLYTFYSRDCQPSDAKGRDERPGNQGWTFRQTVLGAFPVPCPVCCGKVLFVYTTTHRNLNAYFAIFVRCSNFRHQASPRVSPRGSTQRRKVELWASNVR
jgi:hypothetical protein